MSMEKDRFCVIMYLDITTMYYIIELQVFIDTIMHW